MDSFFEGKRIFDQDNEQILVLDSSKISKVYYLSPYVVINKGDLFSPSKWADYSGKDSLASFIPVSDFNLSKYEYISDFGPAAARELKMTIGLPLLSDVYLDYEEVFKMDSLPASSEQEIRNLMEFDCYWTKDNLKEFEGDLYMSESDFLFLHYDINDIREVTREFEQKEIKEIKKSIVDDLELTLLKIAPVDSDYASQGDWYFYSASPEYKDAHVLKLIETIDDLLPFTNFK